MPPAPRDATAPVVVLMGVAGSGKTTVGRLVATALGRAFRDADDLHPPANVAKIASGVPLDDVDREPWMRAVEALVDDVLARGDRVVLAWPALRHVQRERLRRGHDVAFVHLVVPAAVLRERLEARVGHFAGARILPSQLATLEAPGHALAVDGTGTPHEVAARVLDALGAA